MTRPTRCLDAIAKKQGTDTASQALPATLCAEGWTLQVVSGFGPGTQEGGSLGTARERPGCQLLCVL